VIRGAMILALIGHLRAEALSTEMIVVNALGEVIVALQYTKEMTEATIGDLKVLQTVTGIEKTPMRGATVEDGELRLKAKPPHLVACSLVAVPRARLLPLTVRKGIFYKIMWLGLIYHHIAASDYAQRNFANAKSISSKQFFGEEDTLDPAYQVRFCLLDSLFDTNRQLQSDKERRLAKFAGARSISSADYYGRDESGMRGRRDDDDDLVSRLAETAKQDLSALKDTLIEGGRKVRTFHRVENNFILITF